MASLAPKAKVCYHPILYLVVYTLSFGDIIPADSRLLEGNPLKIDQSALTGESLLVTKGPGDGVYSGSTCKQGEIEVIVIATGVHTFFGKAAHLVDTTNQVGHFQKARYFASVYAGENSVQLKGPEIVDQLYYYLRLLTLCFLFSKNPFPVFLESAGFSEANVLLQKPKAGQQVRLSLFTIQF
ncbi:hypothetical protein ACS0TY_008951 [Phlomoides rotata]